MDKLPFSALDRRLLSLEQRWSLPVLALILGAAVLALSALGTSPQFVPVHHGKWYTVLSNNPFDWSDNYNLRFRILAPFLGYVLFLRGPLFPWFMLSLLAEIYQTLPEAGDLDKPKLIFFLDEAHLLFKDAPKAFMEQIEQVIRLIRSKGVGIFFCTQMTQDIPPSVLAQLGNRVHHVIRAFTPNDVKDLKETIKTFPKSEFYDLEKQFTQLGIGQAFITVLNDKGIPTETVVTHLAPPASLMGPLSHEEYQAHLNGSDMYKKYKETVDPRSAFEILNERVQAMQEAQASSTAAPASTTRSAKAEKSTFEQVLTSPVAKQVGKELVRGVFGMLFGSAPRRSSRRGW